MEDSPTPPTDNMLLLNRCEVKGSMFLRFFSRVESFNKTSAEKRRHFSQLIDPMAALARPILNGLWAAEESGFNAFVALACADKRERTDATEIHGDHVRSLTLCFYVRFRGKDRLSVVSIGRLQIHQIHHLIDRYWLSQLHIN